MKRFLVLLAVVTVFATMASAQGTDYEPKTFMLSAGYQKLNLRGAHINTFSVNAELIPLDYVGVKTSASWGENYYSYSPFGLLAMFPALWMDEVDDLMSEYPFAALGMVLFGISSCQFHIPLGDQIELDFGWDEARITKVKKIEDETYITGSLNVGGSIYLGDNVFINPYYEYHHTHNWLYHLFGKDSTENPFSEQPKELSGHSFGIKIGYKF